MGVLQGYGDVGVCDRRAHRRLTVLAARGKVPGRAALRSVGLAFLDGRERVRDRVLALRPRLGATGHVPMSFFS